MPYSRNEALLENILGADNPIGEPQSRNEKLLQKILGHDVEIDLPPKSRIEELLLQISEEGKFLHTEALNVTENGTYEAPEGYAYSPVEVNVASSGSEALMNDVILIDDYEGKIVYSYTAAEFAELTELPENPTHEGLTSQGWNWTLADAKSFVQTYGHIVIGQTYITDDGKTRLYIYVPNTLRATVPLYFSQTVSGGVEINWGDNSAAETIEGTGEVNTSHTYSQSGHYTITLSPAEGCNLTLGASGDYCVLGATDNPNMVYRNMLQKAELGARVNLTDKSFKNCNSLKSITLPQGVTTTGHNGFTECRAVKFVTLPTGVTQVGTQAFYNCSSLNGVSIPKSVQTGSSISNFALSSCGCLKSAILTEGTTGLGTNFLQACISLIFVSIPNTVTSIGNNALNQCRSLTKVTVPTNVTTIGTNALADLSGLKELHVRPTTPPTIQSNSLNNLPADCIIYVPKDKLTAYQGATNWSVYATQMQEEA